MNQKRAIRARILSIAGAAVLGAGAFCLALNPQTGLNTGSVICLSDVEAPAFQYDKAEQQLSIPNAAAAELEAIAAELPQNVKILDFTGNQNITLEDVDAVLPMFPDVEQVTLLDTTLTDEQLKDLIVRHPDTFFLCSLDFAGKQFPTDSDIIDITKCPTTVQETKDTIPFFPRLNKLIMSYCGIEYDEMEALNQSYPDIYIVWTVSVGRDEVRTDSKFFYPAGVSEDNLPGDAHLVNLRYCHDMVAVDIGHAFKVTNCEWVTDMPHLRYLIIAYTKISDLTPLSQLKELVYLEAFCIPITDYSPLLGCTALQDLNIGMTKGDPEPLSHMTWLYNLRWNQGGNNPATRDRVMMLPEQLSDTNVVLTDEPVNIGGNWRYLPNYYVFRDIINALYFGQDYTAFHWGQDSARRIMSTGKGKDLFVGDVLAEILRERIDSGEPMIGIKNIDSEKAELLYQYLLNSKP